MKRWISRNSDDAHSNFPILGRGTAHQEDVAKRLGVSIALVEIMETRGLKTVDDMNVFLSPTLRYLIPPDKWPGLMKAVDVLQKAIAAGREVLIWGDYDVDGVTASALCKDVLRYHGVPMQVHLPDRQKEGYGLNIATLQKVCEEVPEGGRHFVLFTVDCGISDIAAVEKARELGMIVVVSDHHTPPDVLPAAEAVCNPRLHEDSPCPYLAGVGVAFFVMAALNARLAEMRGTAPLDMRKVLDLVALGTLADMVSLTGQNRILAKNGLLKIAEAARPGLAELKSVSGYDRAASLGAWQVVFSLAPRINAAGRVGSAQEAFTLLSADRSEKTVQLAQHLDNLNTARRAEEERVFTEARAQVESMLAERPDLTALVAYKAEWHPGIIGIVASRLVEVFNRPTLVLCKVGGEHGSDILKGSGRSIPEFDLYAGFGGHRQAAGLSIKASLLEELRDAFHRVVRDAVGSEPVCPALKLDGELPFALASDFTFLKSLELLQPFGMGNPEPVFASQPLSLCEMRLFGPRRDHLSLRVKELSSGIVLMAKLWRNAGQFPDSVEKLRLAFSPCINRYNGIASVELTVRDWKVME